MRQMLERVMLTSDAFMLHVYFQPRLSLNKIANLSEWSYLFLVARTHCLSPQYTAAAPTISYSLQDNAFAFFDTTSQLQCAWEYIGDDLRGALLSVVLVSRFRRYVACSPSRCVVGGGSCSDDSCLIPQVPQSSASQTLARGRPGCQPWAKERSAFRVWAKGWLVYLTWA